MTSSPAPGAPKTPWFSGDVKPVRVGPYELECGGSGKSLGYQRWDGVAWGPWAWTPEQAMNYKPGHYADLRYQNDRWRGLSKEPK
jgi:hypothetical protein